MSDIPEGGSETNTLVVEENIYDKAFNSLQAILQTPEEEQSNPRYLETAKQNVEVLVESLNSKDKDQVKNSLIHLNMLLDNYNYQTSTLHGGVGGAMKEYLLDRLFDKRKEISELDEKLSESKLFLFSTMYLWTRDKEKVHEICETMKDTMDFLLNNKKDLSSEAMTEITHCIYYYIGYGSEEQKRWGAEFATKFYVFSNVDISALDRHTALSISNCFDEENQHLAQTGEFIVTSLVEKFGLNGEQTLKLWKESCSKEKMSIAVQENLERMISLEQAYPTSVRTLHNQFGISMFGRYPFDILLAQYEERNLEEKSAWGCLIYARNDWSGAFYADSQKSRSISILSSVFEQAKKEGFRLRVIEASTSEELLTRLKVMHKKYGEISFALANGHGTSGTIALGASGRKNSEVNMDDIAKPNIYDRIFKGKGKYVQIAKEEMQRIFAKGATLILNSCSTGEANGVAEKLSEYGINVIGPKKDTSIKSIRFQSIDEKINFEVEYNESETAAYQAKDR